MSVFHSAGTGGQARRCTNICKCLPQIAPVVAGGPFNSLRPSPFNGANETTPTNVRGCDGAGLEPCLCQGTVPPGSPAGLSAATAMKFAGSCTRMDRNAV